MIKILVGKVPEPTPEQVVFAIVDMAMEHLAEINGIPSNDEFAEELLKLPHAKVTELFESGDVSSISPGLRKRIWAELSLAGQHAGALFNLSHNTPNFDKQVAAWMTRYCPCAACVQQRAAEKNEKGFAE